MGSLINLVADTLPDTGGATSVAWADVTGKPSTFAPSAHVHVIGDVTGLQTALDGKQPLAAVLTGTTASFTTAQESKLAGIAAGATVNAADSALRDRATHTGTQAAATITGLATVATTGAYGDLTGLPALFNGAYASLSGIPSTFAPSAHSHVIADVTGLQTALDGKQDVGGGGSVLSGEVSVTVPNNAIAHTETVTATGVTASNVVMLSLAPHDDADENDPELLDVLAIAARPLTDQIEITTAFGTRTSGPVKFNWSAF